MDQNCQGFENDKVTHLMDHITFRMFISLNPCPKVISSHFNRKLTEQPSSNFKILVQNESQLLEPLISQRWSHSFRYLIVRLNFSLKFCVLVIEHWRKVIKIYGEHSPLIPFVTGPLTLVLAIPLDCTVCLLLGSYNSTLLSTETYC